MYDMLYEQRNSADWQANLKAISTVLASPLWLEYKMEPLDYAVVAVLVGLTVACAVIPAVVPEVAAVTAAVAVLRCVPGELISPCSLAKKALTGEQHASNHSSESVRLYWP